MGAVHSQCGASAAVVDQPGAPNIMTTVSASMCTVVLVTVHHVDLGACFCMACAFRGALWQGATGKGAEGKGRDHVAAHRRAADHVSVFSSGSVGEAHYGIENESRTF